MQIPTRQKGSTGSSTASTIIPGAVSTTATLRSITRHAKIRDRKGYVIICACVLLSGLRPMRKGGLGKHLCHEPKCVRVYRALVIHGFCCRENSSNISFPSVRSVFSGTAAIQVQIVLIEPTVNIEQGPIFPVDLPEYGLNA